MCQFFIVVILIFFLPDKGFCFFFFFYDVCILTYPLKLSLLFGLNLILLWASLMIEMTITVTKARRCVMTYYFSSYKTWSR